MGLLAVPALDTPLVLIIDDVEESRILYRRHLERAGYRVTEAGDAARGVELARALRPAIIVMDLSMPELDGWEATRMLKADPATRAIGIVVLSAFRDGPSRQKAREAGASFFVTKPCLGSELALHVSECIRRCRS